MLRKRIAGLVAIITAAMWLGGCEQQPTDEEYDDVAVAVGALVANGSGGEVGSMSDCVILAQGQTPVDLTVGTEGSVVGLRTGVEYGYGMTCLDAAGSTMEACDATTDSASFSVSWSGVLDLSALGIVGYSYSIERTGEWTLSGLQTGDAELNGQGSFDVVSRYNAMLGFVEEQFSLSYVAEYRAVLIDDLGVIHGGQIVYDVDVHAESGTWISSSETDLFMQAVVAFNAEGQATLEMDGHRAYDLDLVTGSVTLR